MRLPLTRLKTAADVFSPYERTEDIRESRPQVASLLRCGRLVQTIIANYPIDSGWWLTRFTDSDGSFVIQIPKNRNQIRLLLKLSCSFINKNIP